MDDLMDFCTPDDEFNKRRRKFYNEFGFVFDHDFEGLHHKSSFCTLCNEIYGKHIRNEIQETIIQLEDICYCEEKKTCKPHYAIDLLKRIIGEV